MELSKTCLTLIVTVIFSTAALAPQAHADDAADIRATFTTFQSAVLAGDATKASGMLAPSLIDFYERVKPLATGSGALPESVPLVDQLLVEILRLYGGPQPTRRTFADVAGEGLKRGWIQVKGLESIQLGAVSVTGNSAWASVQSQGKPTSWRIPFVKTTSGWRIDPMTCYAMGNLLLQVEVARQGFHPNVTLHAIAASMTPKHK